MMDYILLSLLSTIFNSNQQKLMVMHTGYPTFPFLKSYREGKHKMLVCSIYVAQIDCLPVTAAQVTKTTQIDTYLLE